MIRTQNDIESKTVIGIGHLFVLFSCQLNYMKRMKIQMKKWKLLLGTALVSVALLGCAKTNQPSSPEAAKNAQTVTIGYTQFPANIDPADEYNGWFTVRYGVGETLFKMDDQLVPQPWLAEKIEQTSQLEWKITLRNDVTFQNGEKMTGAKVEASLKRLIEKSKRAADDLGIESIHSDGQTVTIKTKLEQPIMKNLLAEPYSVIVDVDGKAASDKAPVGTGPFLIKTYTPEAGATLEAYSNYWGGKAKVAQVQIKYFSDPTAISAALQSKEVDAVYGLPYANLVTFKKDSQYKISEKELKEDPTKYVYFESLDKNNRVFKDKKEFEKFQNELKEKIKNEKDPKKRKELEKQIYKKLPNTESQLHNIKIDKNGEPYIDTTFPNEKYANNMGQEAVFEKKSGKWVKDGINDATYNIAIWEKNYKLNELYYHLKSGTGDVKLWKKYGVGPNDKLTEEQRNILYEISEIYYLDKDFQDYLNLNKSKKITLKEYENYLYNKYKENGDE